MQLVGETNPQLQRVTLQRREVADAHDLQTLLVADRNAGHHVGDNRPSQTVQFSRCARIGLPGDVEFLAIVRLLNGDFGPVGERQFTLGTFDGDGLAVDRHGHTGRDRDGLFTDAAHGRSLVIGWCSFS